VEDAIAEGETYRTSFHGGILQANHKITPPLEENMRKTEFLAWVFIMALSFIYTVQADEKARPGINADSEIRPVTSLTDKEARDVSFAAEANII
jgi:hypothetical protein